MLFSGMQDYSLTKKSLISLGNPGFVPNKLFLSLKYKKNMKKKKKKKKKEKG